MTATTAARPRKALLAVAAAAVTAVTVLGAAPAEAATATKKCGDGPANCVLTKVHPRKGTVKVRVDNTGGDKAYRYAWDLRHNGRILCTGEVRERWPAKTFTCKNMPKGKLTLTVSYEKNSAVGLQW
ncbi:hypothetical protein ABT052_28265 [Streptomyces sp. NPDC002766]|jgi:hypothetical protein|uniref:hypothetical protein n=1 Tax=unclassified Streptomyces TaxID=2593676 RepID=UPI00332BA69C